MTTIYGPVITHPSGWVPIADVELAAQTVQEAPTEPTPVQEDPTADAVAMAALLVALVAGDAVAVAAALVAAGFVQAVAAGVAALVVGGDPPTNGSSSVTGNQPDRRHARNGWPLDARSHHQAGPGISWARRTNLSRSARYALKAARRVADGVANGRSLGAALRAERRHADAHKAANGARLTAGRAADSVAASSGSNTLRWMTAQDGRVTPDCARMHGKLFDLKNPPKIGIPGGVHRACRCKAVPVSVNLSRPINTPGEIEMSLPDNAWSGPYSDPLPGTERYGVADAEAYYRAQNPLLFGGDSLPGAPKREIGYTPESAKSGGDYFPAVGIVAEDTIDGRLWRQAILRSRADQHEQLRIARDYVERNF